MYSVHQSHLPTDPTALSRHAGERHAVLTAIRQQRAVRSRRTSRTSRLPSLVLEAWFRRHRVS